MRQKRFQKIAVSVTAVLSFAICGFLYSCRSSGSTVVRTVEQGLSVAPPESMAEESSSISFDDSNYEACFVYVCGHVVDPGVYEASADSRIFEVIRMAGGPTEDGCLEALNLADRVYDGQKLYVPSYSEYEECPGEEVSRGSNGGEGPVQEGSGRVNINTAGIEALMTLPGIGSSRAEAIIEYRDSHGGFDSIEDIMKVSGIKEGAFQKIKDLICTR